ncbi:hypothetical protein Pcinc_007730 [Petrolisthes cinctipes]|uniref:DDE Tnp4 domain-containing protein n=1 Tax=Petrolisthes cinctipes TaxID=88211 RepID=A0AAE1GAI0_PETCI|nr:hypothetical protein Pcinc_007730 [Petrolisthes cinctipes]
MIYQALEAGEYPGHLLGDSGYPCRHYLLTPLLNPQGRKEEKYNRSHIQTRNTIERAFGVLKKRFACLGKVMRTKQDTTKAIIVACFVLHNLAVTTGVIDPIEMLEVNDEFQHADAPVYAGNRNNDHGKRRAIINDYF